MAFDGGVAASYLASFRPVEPVRGFGDVLSTQGMTTLGQLPAQNALMEADLAAEGLREIGANQRLEMNLDAIAAQNQLQRQAVRRAGALRLAGQMFQNAMPGDQVAGVGIEDPLALIERLQKFSLGQARSRAERTLRSNTYATELLRGLG